MSDEKKGTSRKAFLLTQLAEAFGVNLSESRLRALLFAMLPLSPEELERGVRAALRSGKHVTMPTPNQLFQLCRPEISKKQVATEVSARIVTAVKRFGYPWPHEAREFVGEVGWKVIELQGGWAQVCEQMNNSRIPMFQAQFRELAETVIIKAETGDLDFPPQLPEPKSKKEYLKAREKDPKSILEGSMSEDQRRHKMIEIQQLLLKKGIE